MLVRFHYSKKGEFVPYPHFFFAGGRYRLRIMVEDDEEDLWDFVTRDVKPIARNKPLKVVVSHKKSAARRVVDSAGQRQVDELPDQISERDHAGVGLDRKTADRLRKGQIPLEGRLDLHGMNQVQAHKALEVFIMQAQREGRRCVLVITGKGAGEDGRRDPLSSGQGVLKRRVPQWLASGSLQGYVLKSVPAQARHGGDGALYVLLKRQR